MADTATAAFPPPVFDPDKIFHGFADRPLPPRRLRGVRLRAVPSGPLLAQLVGAAATLAGVFLIWGVAITLIVGGVAIMALGTLREAGKI